MRPRLLIYFGGLIAAIVLVNTPAPKIFMSAVLNPEAGDAVGRSLSSVTKDLVLVLLISLYFEWARTRGQAELLRDIDHKLDAMREESRSASASSTRKLVLDATPPEELVTTALDRHIPQSRDKSSFVSLMLSPKPAHHDVSVMMRAERGAGDTLLISHRFDFTTSRGPILIAATTSPKHAATLSAACPQLLDATALPRSTPFPEAVKAYGDRLECYVERQQGSLKKVDFRTVLPGELTRYISPPVKIALADIALFVADLSQESSERVRLSVHTRWSQALSEHFIYWFADRPMFLRTLTVDVRAVLEPEREVHVQEFLGGVGSLMRDVGDGHLALSPDRWVVQGQGVIAVW
ncbi:hypothetical protein [Lentzea terrae]|uniref:hypothetical protein n=1 Tax=Lentzea terrae TaxID=2200761 RepID=UPI000DD36D95|nr:hypothetical protein [Lentzea terrae]